MNNAEQIARLIDDITWGLRLADRYDVKANVIYATKAGVNLMLDVYKPKRCTTPKPTLMYMHPGGWADFATKETFALWFLPFLQLGWVVVNVDYRSSGVSPAPAAVEDCLRALGWIHRHANAHNIDMTQVILAGHSAGGHLALTTGMIWGAPVIAAGWPDMASLGVVPESPEFKPAAIINWYGITDVADLCKGENRQEWAVKWVGDDEVRLTVANLVSPLTYVRADLPPIITIHGDGDLTVPYRHAVRLHDALTEVGVVNKLVTLRGQDHDVDVDANRHGYSAVFEFLEEVGMPLRVGEPGSSAN